jgi:hypothetical protein
MMFAGESTATFNAGPEFTGTRGTSCRKPVRRWSALAATVVARLRALAPYAAMLVLPGGSLMALLLWLYLSPAEEGMVGGNSPNDRHLGKRPIRPIFH